MLPHERTLSSPSSRSQRRLDAVWRALRDPRRDTALVRLGLRRARGGDRVHLLPGVDGGRRRARPRRRAGRHDLARGAGRRDGRAGHARGAGRASTTRSTRAGSTFMQQLRFYLERHPGHGPRGPCTSSPPAGTSGSAPRTRSDRVREDGALVIRTRERVIVTEYRLKALVEEARRPGGRDRASRAGRRRAARPPRADGGDDAAPGRVGEPGLDPRRAAVALPQQRVVVVEVQPPRLDRERQDRAGRAAPRAPAASSRSTARASAARSAAQEWLPRVLEAGTGELKRLAGEAHGRRARVHHRHEGG